ncbi:MAG TPA: hypothetical protein VJ208_02040 [Candidatus Nanoarchaeia archaeon]|nr:hypothetical protein [Candidatus Nanoarchaeia archaeon]
MGNLRVFDSAEEVDRMIREYSDLSSLLERVKGYSFLNFKECYGDSEIIRQNIERRLNSLKQYSDIPCIRELIENAGGEGRLKI